MASRSSREKTVPVGLLGLQRMIALVRSLNAAASSSGSNRQCGGRSGTNRGVGAGQDAVGPVVLVERLRQDHLVARIDQREQRDQHRLGAAAGDGDLGLGIDPQSQVPIGMLGDRLAQLVRPQVIAYWLMSSSMARQAASLISAGAGKSGIPCARFTAPCRRASIDMPRITLSVNRAAFWEISGSCIVIAVARWSRVGSEGDQGRLTESRERPPAAP